MLISKFPYVVRMQVNGRAVDFCFNTEQEAMQEIARRGVEQLIHIRENQRG